MAAKKSSRSKRKSTGKSTSKNKRARADGPRPAKKAARDRAAVAKRAYPRWEVEERSAADVRRPAADAVTPDLAGLQKKYGKPTADMADPPRSKKGARGDQNAGLVTLRPTDPQDTRAKPLSVFVQDGKVKGVQG
jgi:hypothetical protein